MIRAPESPALPLTTERLVLRELASADIPAIQAYATRRRFWQYLQIGPVTRPLVEDFVGRARREQQEDPRAEFNLAVVLAGEDQLIGAVRIGISSWENQEALLGYGLNPAYWGQGYGKEAVARLLAFGFGPLELHRIFATCEQENEASCRLLTSLGLRHEGTLREHLLVDGRWRSSHLYAILAREHRRSR